MVPVAKSEMKYEDRVSKLPDDVIARILSCLPTNNAVATCVLSKDWIHKWTRIYNVDINDCKLMQTHDDKTILFKFLRKILNQVRNPQRIHLCLFCTSDLWMLCEDFVLHGSLLNTNSLNNLCFQHLVWKIPAENHFPNLVALKLGNVLILNENSHTRTLIFTLPAAKEISLENCDWPATNVEIFAPMLKSFMSSNACSELYYEDCTINIIGAKLEKFSSRYYLENFILTESTVVSATLETVEDLRRGGSSVYDNGLHVRSLLKEFSSSLEDLTLPFYLVQAIAFSEQGFLLSNCEKLGRLVLCDDGYKGGRSTEELFELLYETPSLKILVIKMEYWYCDDYDAVECVPWCIMSSLEEVELHILSRCEMPEAIDLAKYLLENGAQLKRLRYLICDDQCVDDIMKKLLSFSRASTDVIISVQTLECM